MTPTFLDKWWESNHEDKKNNIPINPQFENVNTILCLSSNEGPCWKQVSGSVSLFPLFCAQFKVKFTEMYGTISCIFQRHRLSHVEVSHEILQHHRQCKSGGFCSVSQCYRRQQNHLTLPLFLFIIVIYVYILPPGPPEADPGQLHPQCGDWWTLHHCRPSGQGCAGQGHTQHHASRYLKPNF